MCAWISLVCPSAWFCFQRFQYYYERTYIFNANISKTVLKSDEHGATPPKIANIHDSICLQSFTEDGTDIELKISEKSLNSKPDEQNQNLSISRHSFSSVNSSPYCFESFLHKCLNFVLPSSWKSYYALYMNSADSVVNSAQTTIIHTKHRFLLRINNFLAVILSFGVIFPPLAVVVFCSICILLYFECKNFVRILYFILHYENDLALNQEIEECLGILKLIKLRRVNLTIMILSCCLLGFVLFDTLGDIQSARIASIPLLLMVLIPLVFASILSFCRTSLKENVEGPIMDIDTSSVSVNPILASPSEEDNRGNIKPFEIS
jgi:hypothetical protein